MRMRSMDGNTLFAIFQTFAMDTSLLRLIFIKYVKKVQGVRRPSGPRGGFRVQTAPLPLKNSPWRPPNEGVCFDVLIEKSLKRILYIKVPNKITGGYTLSWLAEFQQIFFLQVSESYTCSKFQELFQPLVTLTRFRREDSDDDILRFTDKTLK